MLGVLLTSFSAWAQNEPVEMATGLRSSGKIYVVVAVLLLIFIGFILYLIRIDRKVTRLEKLEKENRQTHLS